MQQNNCIERFQNTIGYQHTCIKKKTNSRFRYPNRKIVILSSYLQSVKYRDLEWSANKLIIFFFKVLKVKAGKTEGQDELLLPEAKVCIRFSSYLGQKLLKVPHKDLSLLLNELLTAELQVSVHILLRVDVVLLYLWSSLGGHREKGFSTIKWWFPWQVLSKCMVCFNKKGGKINTLPPTGIQVWHCDCWVGRIWEQPWGSGFWRQHLAEKKAKRLNLGWVVELECPLVLQI